jgi:hypothetical protein
MKRTYMNPTLEVIKIETTQMLAASTMTLPLNDSPNIDNPSQILVPSFDFED